MQTTDFIWQNGKFLPWHDAKTHVLTHTLHYGGGVFEGIRAYRTENGTAVFRIKEHLERMFYSASVINMELPYSLQELTDVIVELLRKNKLEQGYIRPIAYYGYGKMGVNPIGAPVELAVACWPWGAYLPDEVNIQTSQYIRIPANVSIADAKLCGNYINGILAILKLQGTHYQEALFLDTNEHIAEGPGENFFMVKDNVIYTPKLGAILAGVTRATVMEIAENLGYRVEEKDIRLQEAYAADETFFTGTAAEVSPIRSIDDKVIGSGKPGPITSELRKNYLDIVYGRNKKYSHYLTYV